MILDEAISPRKSDIVSFFQSGQSAVVFFSCDAFLLTAAIPVTAARPLFVFNPHGGMAATAHVKRKVIREVVCRELNKPEGNAITDIFWCPIVGGNVFIYLLQDR